MLKRVLQALVLFLGITALAGPAFAGEAEERNKAVARIVFEEILGRGKFEEYESVYAPGYISHGSHGDVGRDQDRASVKNWRQAFPDLRITMEQVVAEGDLVAVHFVAEGANTGAANGMPATGKSVRIPAMTIFRFTDGKIVEEWPMFNELDFLRQLGLMPGGSK
jgi:steroid delta-isomerase-like uncharacterized protein